MRHRLLLVVAVLFLGLLTTLVWAQTPATPLYLPLVLTNGSQVTSIPTIQPTPTATVAPSCDITTGFPNLRGRDLSGCDLSGANLSTADLTGANLSSAALFDTNLTNTNLTNTNLNIADLAHANLTSANLTSANLTSADLSGANLTDATNGPTAGITGVTWSNTTCPDHSNSNQDGGTCKSHGF